MINSWLLTKVSDINNVNICSAPTSHIFRMLCRSQSRVTCHLSLVTCHLSLVTWTFQWEYQIWWQAAMRHIAFIIQHQLTTNISLHLSRTTEKTRKETFLKSTLTSCSCSIFYFVVRRDTYDTYDNMTQWHIVGFNLFVSLGLHYG